MTRGQTARRARPPTCAWSLTAVPGSSAGSRTVCCATAAPRGRVAGSAFARRPGSGRTSVRSPLRSRAVRSACPRRTTCSARGSTSERSVPTKPSSTTAPDPVTTSPSELAGPGPDRRSVDRFEPLRPLPRRPCLAGSGEGFVRGGTSAGRARRAGTVSLHSTGSACDDVRVGRGGFSGRSAYFSPTRCRFGAGSIVVEPDRKRRSDDFQQKG